MALYIHEDRVHLVFKRLAGGLYVSEKNYGDEYQFIIQRTKAEWHVYLIEKGSEELFIFDKRAFLTYYEAEQFAKWLQLGFTMNYVARGDSISKENLNL